MVDNSNEPTGKGRATPSRKEAEAARKKQMKQPLTRKELRAKDNEARRLQRAKAQEAMKSGTDDRYLPLREKGPVRRFCRDFVDRRFNMAEFLLPILILILILTVVPVSWGPAVVAVLWTGTILATILDEILMVRRLKRELKARFEPGEIRGAVPYTVLRTTQLRRFRMPKPQIKRGEPLRDRY